MVYCGRPSKSCRKCRDRNIKCDKKVPSCGQCLRASHQCPGYVDPNQLIIRDQTRSTIEKTSWIVLARMGDISVPPPILPAVEQRAKWLFFSHHVVHKPTVYTCLTAFYPPDPDDTCFIKCMHAVCLAYLGVKAQSPEIFDMARRNYGQTLRLLNLALQDAHKARENRTLMIVLLLVYFENLVTAQKDLSAEEVKGRKKHIEGALALLKLRDREKIEDPAACEVFDHLTKMVYASCHEWGVDIPEERWRIFEVENCQDPS